MEELNKSETMKLNVKDYFPGLDNCLYTYGDWYNCHEGGDPRYYYIDEINDIEYNIYYDKKYPNTSIEVVISQYEKVGDKYKMNNATCTPYSLKAAEIAIWDWIRNNANNLKPTK